MSVTNVFDGSLLSSSTWSGAVAGTTARTFDDNWRIISDSVNGAFMLVRTEALRDVGLLDEGYWLYMDDLDWCYRFHRKGWDVWYDGRVSILHVKGGTTVVERHQARHRGLRHNVAFHRSMGRFYRKFYGGRRPGFDALIYAAIGIKLAVAVLRSTVARRRLV